MSAIVPFDRRDAQTENTLSRGNPSRETLKFDNSDMFTSKCQRGVFWQLLLFLQKQKHSLYCVNLTGTAFSCFLSPQQKK